MAHISQRPLPRLCIFSGNRSWGKPSEDIPNTPSSFEQIVRQLKLAEKEISEFDCLETMGAKAQR
jgi:hypothetical protein